MGGNSLLRFGEADLELTENPTLPASLWNVAWLSMDRLHRLRRRCARLVTLEGEESEAKAAQSLRHDHDRVDDRRDDIGDPGDAGLPPFRIRHRKCRGQRSPSATEDDSHGDSDVSDPARGESSQSSGELG